MRARAAAAAAAAIVVLVIVIASTGGSRAAPPATGAATVVPGDALAYVHVSIEPNRPAVSAALKLAQRFPTYPLIAAGAVARLSAIVAGGGTADFAHDIRPWLGREVALALLNTQTSTAGSELVLDVARRTLAHAFILRAGASTDAAYRGIPVYRYRSGAALAFVRHYLVVGQPASVRSAIDAATGQLPSLDASPVYRGAASGEAADRVLDVYASSAGVQRLLVPQGGLIGALGALLYEPDLTGVAVSLSAAGTEAKLRVHAVFDPNLPGHGGSGAFTPSLDGELPAGSLLALDVIGLDRIAPHVLNAGTAGGIGVQIGPLLRQLGAALAAEGVDVKQIESLFSGETVVAIPPGRGLVIVTRTKDEQAVRTELANLEVPLSQLFPPPASGSGQVAQIREEALDGVSAHQLILAPGLELDYAVFRGLIAVSTSLRGIADVVRHPRSLIDESAYRATLSGRPDRVTSLVFLDFSQLLNLAEQTGLLRGTRYRALQPDIARVRAAGLDSTRGEADSTAELTLQIS